MKKLLIFLILIVSASSVYAQTHADSVELVILKIKTGVQDPFPNIETAIGKVVLIESKINGIYYQTVVIMGNNMDLYFRLSENKINADIDGGSISFERQLTSQDIKWLYGIIFME